MNKSKPTYQELEKRLAVAEPIIEALKNHEVDAVVGNDTIAVLLLREVEEALRISDAGFRAMFELSGIGMIQADTPDFRFTRVNRKFCEIAGYSAEELLARALPARSVVPVVIVAVKVVLGESRAAGVNVAVFPMAA